MYLHYKFEPQDEALKKREHADIQLLYITHACYNESWKSVMHSHPFTEIFYILNGYGKFNMDGNISPVKSDDLIIINPNIMHTEFNDGDKPLEYIVLGINDLSFHPQIAEKSNDSLYNLSSCRNEVIFCLEMILREVRCKKENYVPICTNCLDTLLLLISRNTNAAFDAASTSKAKRECLFIEQYIDEHFSEDITLDSLSRLTYIDKYYMVHVFKKYTGDSPIRFLIKRRITEAKYLLETTNYSAAKIAQYIGFSSQSYFSQAFFKEVGMTPIQYRKAFDKA